VGPGRRAASSVPVVRRTGRRASSRALSTTRLTDRREPAGERSKRGVLEGVRAGGSDLRTGRGPGSAGARRGKRDRGQRGQQPLRYTASQAKRASASAATSLHLWRRPTKARRERDREACGAMRPCGKTARATRYPRPAPPPPAPGGPRSARFCRLTGRHAKTHATAPHTRLRRGITTLTIQCLDARYSTRDSTFSHSRERSQSQ
jgi:hypothetical protein